MWRLTDLSWFHFSMAPTSLPLHQPFHSAHPLPPPSSHPPTQSVSPDRILNLADQIRPCCDLLVVHISMTVENTEWCPFQPFNIQNVGYTNQLRWPA